MFKSRGRTLSYANVTATLALIFAMSGGALAANHYLINSTKQINPKVLKKLKGQAGRAGLNGAAGKDGAPGKEGVSGVLRWRTTVATAAKTTATISAIARRLSDKPATLPSPN